MAYHVELAIAAKTDTGLVRSHNEDALAINPEYGLVILADGMGGYNADEVASGIATLVIEESLENQLQHENWDTHINLSKHIQQAVVESIVRANISIIEAALNEPEYSGMGTTLVLALFHHDKVTIAHVGDSRAYRFRQGELVQITRDHSLLQEQLDAGLITLEEAQFSQNRNLITRALGVDYDIEVEIHDHQTEAGDIYVLCSDGLSDMLSTKQISDILVMSGSNLEAASNTLVQRENDHGGRDNISTILVRVLSKDAQAEGLLGRVLQWIK
ncbi:MAG: Stp1/IreP family PP2C-type Ser/Thr phosphatase [Burkholderiaceae bacterium]